jgi:hypothetical protein
VSTKNRGLYPSHTRAKPWHTGSALYDFGIGAVRHRVLFGAGMARRRSQSGPNQGRSLTTQTTHLSTLTTSKAELTLQGEDVATMAKYRLGRVALHLICLCAAVIAGYPPA